MKTCKNCGTERADGVRNCPVCRKASTAAYHAANSENISLCKKAYYADNKGKVSLQHKAYNAANRESLSLQKKAYAAANSEKISLRMKAYSAANKEKMNLYNKSWHAANREQISLKKKAHHAANPEKQLARNAKKTLKQNGIDPAQNKELVNAITKLRFISQLIKLRKNENNRK